MPSPAEAANAETRRTQCPASDRPRSRGAAEQAAPVQGLGPPATANPPERWSRLKLVKLKISQRDEEQCSRKKALAMEAMSAFAPPPPPTQLMVPVVGYGGGGGGGAGEGTTTAVRGSYGPVIAMLAVLAVLAAAAVAVGRLCFGRRVHLGQAAAGHDLEAWVERTCGPCVGARIFSTAGGAKEEGGEASAAPAEPPPPPPPAAAAEGTERGEDSCIVSGGS
ncbi:hypothetical protein OsJ_04350 [Oryza sativa Japonica Group]|uniref:Uncharacterized protein n=3 Tax=Oryza sativa subsp. japonica TaxID=39947 RepID=B9EV95_ORYSJ|nr:hypothetical protein OsJ_04350 [Oryza sativa Japonica Group]